MNTRIFSTALHAFGHSVSRLAPAVLAGSTLLGSLGISSVASAQERVVVAAPGPVVVASRPAVEEVVVGGPGVYVHRRHIVAPYVAPAYYGYGPTWGAGYYGPAWRGGYGGFHGGYQGGGGFHGGGFHGGGFHGTFHSR